MLSYNLDLKPLSPCKSEPLKKLKSSHLQMFFKIGNIKTCNIHRKTPVLGSFLNKVAGLKVCKFLQIDFNTGVSCGYSKLLRIVFLYNTSGGCFQQSYHGTVKPAGMPVHWFRASSCFQFWSKTFMKHCSNNSLLSRDKSISSLLDLIGHMI